ncbi:MAG: hypothetical protein EB116_11940 [Betaproteobacteria bacterium]|nr:hypothetical protein [Betaproteobacteria bacterium]
MNGFLFYRGKSPIDGAPLIAIATLTTTNRKTGDMVQTWILREDISPTEARRTGADRSYCGDCPVRGPCYVNWGQAPSSIWHAYHRGNYVDLRRKPAMMRRIVSGRIVRMGAAGDPAMIPLQHWARVLEGADGWTGYTHQWRKPWAQPMRELCMASVETIEDQDLARAMGWRTYRIRRPDDALATNEIACPSDVTGRQCIACKACDGALKPSAASVAIIIHGPKAKAWI